MKMSTIATTGLAERWPTHVQHAEREAAVSKGWRFDLVVLHDGGERVGIRGHNLIFPHPVVAYKENPHRKEQKMTAQHDTMAPSQVGSKARARRTTSSRVFVGHEFLTFRLGDERLEHERVTLINGPGPPGHILSKGSFRGQMYSTRTCVHAVGAELRACS